MSEDSKSKGKASGDIAAEFDALWEVWPDQGRERSQGHKACLKAFKAACEDHAPGRIVEAAAAFVARTKPQWVPGLHKWLAERKFEHFLPGASPAAEAPPARQRPELVRPGGRAGDCVDEIITAYGMAAAEAWLGGTNWTEDEVQLPSEYDRLQVDQRFGGVLRRHGFAAGLQAS